MSGIRMVFVEKKAGFNVESQILLKDFKDNLGIEALEDVRVLNKYILGDMEEEQYVRTVNTILSEAPVDRVYEENFEIGQDEIAFGVEYLPGQYDQRADSASECIMLLIEEEKIPVKSSKVIILKGNLNEEEIKKIKSYYINPVDSREVSPLSKVLEENLEEPNEVEVLNGFLDLNEEGLKNFHRDKSLAMSLEDLKLIRDYFKSEDRNPTITEIKVIDTYWSDHCRHTTFETIIKDVYIEEGKYSEPIKKAYEDYKNSRAYVYGENLNNKEVKLMDLATIAMKELRKRGELDDLDVSEEINACSINIEIETDKGTEEYLLMFKNETHNHPTEIEPFGGAATCLGGAIRDPLSGRSYVYQAMRVTGSADPTVEICETLKGKLPQRKITLGAAHGYSSYGNQIGLATGQVSEIYHPNYAAKRMEVGAVIAATPKENVIRLKPSKGDIVILLGGRTGRDGIGGATGSSKEHTEESINQCGAEVQKGNAPTERKIQRLFRNKEVAQMIKRCNDFGAGGVSVAIGELCRGIDIDLNKVPKKYEGLDGTELAISESQERMAVVISSENADRFIKLSEEENLEATIVAEVTDTDRLRMNWKDKTIVDIKRSFLDTNGAKQEISLKVKSPSAYPYEIKNCDVKEEWLKSLRNLNVCSQKGLIERFDSTIGGGTVLMPLGGKYQLTPAEGMAAKIPVLGGESKDASLMTYGFNPYLGVWSPFHMAFYSVIESVTKISAMGGDYKKVRLTFQEYFEKLLRDEEKWGKPFAALLGAYKAQMDLGLPAIGGKDSMSGSFGELNVPPTLVSFAVGLEKASRIISPEFKNIGSTLVLMKGEKLEDGTLEIEGFKNNLEKLYELIGEEKVVSAYSLKFGGVSEGITKMSLGNRIGATLNNISKEELFGFNYGSLILEAKEGVNLEEEFKGTNYKVIGNTIEADVIKCEEYDFEVSLEELEKSYEEKLEYVFKSKTEDKEGGFSDLISNDKDGANILDNGQMHIEEKLKSKITRVEKPRVVIPVFPGTNCEYDCRRAFEKEGAEVSEVIIRNLNKEALSDSINMLKKEIDKSQIIMLPGGFSAGDEPDGSAKFIATIFRNPKIKDSVMKLLNERDGLILGICNGFQALIKLGLLPYGKIIDIEEDMATLTYNNINRHMSSIVRTKITSKKSPWFNEVSLGEVHSIPISHGEGRFVAPESLIKELVENDQIATQYVDLEGNMAMNMPYNPNGSSLAIEGITSRDGRILGKMGHSERIGDNLYKNIPGEFDQKLFKSGVDYFRK
ncbi:phosphoribosylformylglycinamidine synthase [Clostridium perfringens]|uniref:Phosphoribosylformylglycinamidine synthase n=1 Tax=Clostridium perfringens (strain SM101 / Type A) TaxID=289380 RepID=Q0SV54_CLOPS|nr:phosphoribosylformylglycinamidine synthase [Clostridium perfringens]ABG85769.1 phosphoribosylformylglycinamidine synthase [Clostridium perfringens SM101]EJT6151701.1 phosphoribosylformylglycinamidine synthase [Clostridium perfringens]EJT6157402.1 phosphoribosylformylglycinamidine synthase [Clostridium perfringens]MBP2860677.1 phosphoribosylformylglycinamidine synthase [Clostridium perfringens]MDH5061606.1 Phosphoribosylformylglycinamidine synthase [Clostridium perfringens NCTC 8239]